MMEQELLVIRVADIETTRIFFEGLGLDFVKEKHGSGPEHYAHVSGDRVFEIYPEKVEQGYREDIDCPQCLQTNEHLPSAAGISRRLPKVQP